MNYLTKRQYANAKRSLTIACKTMQTDPQHTIDHIDAQFEAWNDGGYAYPDSWHRWQIARDDAVGIALRKADRW